MREQKLKSDTHILIGNNIREIRKEKNIGQTELIRLLDLCICQPKIRSTAH